MKNVLECLVEYRMDFRFINYCIVIKMERFKYPINAIYLWTRVIIARLRRKYWKRY